ncbi:uncharacterized protein TNIN_419921 [Trichonephila inaurata madagascariensis]|uniref:Protein MIS12 homolog n=1 Tax=Trichonephila inaurata madagascariensis TaxID=2747483 RepID=A0A8X6XXD9_9ARAC|nr:uncharacterized protein TNIN_419921 [Trichonephila inaurata madagascariensis]
MDFEAIMELDYETQHFGIHPRTFLDRVYNAFYESLFDGLNEMKKYISEEYNHVVSTEVIHSSSDSLFQALVKKLDKAIDKLEIYLDANVFMIPNHVVLPEDEIHLTNPSTKEQEKELDEEIEQIKQRIIVERIHKSILKTKIEEQKYIKEELLIFKNKLQQLLAIVQHSRETQEEQNFTMEKCFELWNTLKQPHFKKNFK